MSDSRKKSVIYGILAALLTAACLFIILWRAGFYPFGPDSLMRVDLESQYADFIVFFKNSSLREKIYSFSKNYGGATTGLITYYTLSPFNLIVFLLSEYNMELAVFLIITAKFIFMGQGAYWYLNRHFADKRINLVFMLIYVLYPYFIRYYFNIIWLDCFALLPFLLLLTENIADGKQGKCFVVLYTYALLSNYYITYIISLFILMYFFWYSFARKSYSVSCVFRQALQMAFYVAVSAMLAAPMLLPSAFQLFSGKLSAGTGTVGETPVFNILTALLSFFDGAHFVDLVPAFAAGVCTVFLLVAFFTSRKAYTKENIWLVVMFVFVGISTYFAQLYYIWHCFAWPEGFVPRFSCVYAILLMIICRKAYDYLDGKASVKALCLLAVIYAVCFWFYRWTPQFPWTFSVLGMTALSVMVCSVLYIMLLKWEKQAKILFCIFMAIDILANGYMNMRGERAFQLVDPTPAHTYETHYAATKRAMATINDDGFYRMESLQRASSNQPMSAGFNGIDHFSSTYDSARSEMHAHFGNQAVFYGVEYLQSRLVTDSFLGIKYLLSSDVDNPPEGYELMTQGEKNVYYNPYYFPVVFTGDTAEIEYNADWKQHINNMTMTLADSEVVDEDGNTDLRRLKAVSEIMQSNSAEIISQDGGNLELTATGNYLLTTIMYDDCWHIEVNGKAVKAEKFMEYFIAVPLDNTAESCVSMKYVPKGLSAGILIMLMAVVVIMVKCYIDYKKSKEVNNGII